MSQNYYAPGSIHDDRHKEMNVQINGNLSNDQLAKLASDFFADDEASEVHPIEAEDETALKNIIFNPHIFLKEEHYERLRQVILSYIKVNEEPAREEYRIEATAQNEWYYILKAVKEADIASRSELTPTKFIKQMIMWYPKLFPLKEGEDVNAMARRYMSSISAESQKWLRGLDKQEVPIKDMFAHQQTMNYNQAWTIRVRGVALGLKNALIALKSDIL